MTGRGAYYPRGTVRFALAVILLANVALGGIVWGAVELVEHVEQMQGDVG